MFSSENRIHINFSEDRASDGTLIRSTVLLNVYENDIKSAIDLYQELRKQLENDPNTVRNNDNVQTEVMSSPECPDHKVKMILRTRRDGTGFFWGCPMYKNGCKKTMPYAINQDIVVKMPSFTHGLN